MIRAPLLALLTATAVPCEQLAELDEGWDQLDEPVLLARMDLVESFVGGLRRPSDASLPLAERAHHWKARLRAACALDDVASTPEQVDRVLLEQILSSSDFATARARQTDLVLRLVRTLEQWLLGLFETSGAASYSNWARTAVLAGAIVAVVLGLSRLLRLRRGRRRHSPRQAAPQPLKALESPGAHLDRSQRLLAEAPREAIREGLLALLSWLEEQRLARPDRVRTNRELIAELPARGATAELAHSIAGLVDWFDRTYYSLAPVTTDDARRFLDDVTTLSRGPNPA